MNPMRGRGYLSHHYVYFSRWTRKGYAVFAGLGREVRIARLAISMYREVLLKSASCGVIVNTDKVSDAAILIKPTDIFWKMTSNLRGEVYPGGNVVYMI